jgi:hypothetical protein
MPCKRTSILSLFTLLALAGCATSSPDKAAAPATAPASAAADGRCDSDTAKYTLGQFATPALLQQAQKRSGAQIARILKPGDVMTLEYRPERLNLNVDGKGLVTRVNCG